MSFDSVFQKWLIESLSVEIPKNVKAFSFNLLELETGFGIELIGASKFDINNSDWACEEVFEATPRQIEIPLAYSGKTWQACLNMCDS